MSKNINIAVIGLGQIGSYVYNELNIKKKDIEIKTGKKIKVVGISAKNKNKKRKFKINKKNILLKSFRYFKNKKSSYNNRSNRIIRWNIKKSY